ncbi:MAG: isoprenyl transferase [Candidatus Hydrogenedentes bacterium]|nr:isoprenyl transferase [Candidatus Hydrogenedentota bacterium]
MTIAELERKLDPNRLPAHVAIIMDGNRRWAKKRGLSPVAGHEAGVTAVRRTVRAARDIGIKNLTLYAFSTENWKRSRVEIRSLWRLLRKYVRTEMETMQRENVQVRVMGRREELPATVQKDIAMIEKATADNDGSVLNIALNYGGQQELVDAARRVADDVAHGKLAPADISTAVFSKYLYTAGLPDLDMLIRTSGEYRVSNFMLWQISYAELIFVDTLWPNFGKRQLLESVLEFQKRQRRFGGAGAP